MTEQTPGTAQRWRIEARLANGEWSADEWTLIYERDGFRREFGPFMEHEAVAARDALNGALSALPQPVPENALERFERLAEEFYEDTLLLAPGKSVAMETWTQTYEDERQAAWKIWIAARRRVGLPVALSALPEETGRERLLLLARKEQRSAEMLDDEARLKFAEAVIAFLTVVPSQAGSAPADALSVQYLTGLIEGAAWAEGPHQQNISPDQAEAWATEILPYVRSAAISQGAGKKLETGELLALYSKHYGELRPKLTHDAAHEAALFTVYLRGRSSPFARGAASPSSGEAL